MHTEPHRSGSVPPILGNLKLDRGRGRGSVEVISPDELRRDGARGKQVSAYRLGEFIVIGPEPTPHHEECSRSRTK
jgi:hypothetical protein